MRIDLGLDLLRTSHPRLGPDRPRPVCEARDEPKVFLHMLLADPAGRDHPAGGEGQGLAVDLLQEENPLGMMAQRPVPKVGQDEFRGVEKFMKSQVVLDRAAPLFHRGQGVVIRMCHHRPLRNRGCRVRTR